MEPLVTIEHERGTLSGPELEHVVRLVLDELRTADDLDTLAASAGLKAEDVREISVEVEESEAGIDPVIAYILIHLAGGALSAAGGAGAKLFWSKVILPRVRKAKRADAIGAPRASDDAS